MEDYDKARRQRRFRNKSLHPGREGHAVPLKDVGQHRKTQRQRLDYRDYAEPDDDGDYYGDVEESFED